MNEFFRCLLESNPFGVSAVSEPRDAAVHVEAIHQRQFHRLVACAEEVRATRGHQGLVVWGEAGIGKSHLLARLQRWGEHEGRACCVLVHHLASDPAAQPWYVVRSAIHQMTGDRRGGLRKTPLFRMVREAVKQAMAKLPPQESPYRVGQVLDALLRLVDRRLEDGARSGPETQQICDVLFQFFVAAHRDQGPESGNRAALLAVRWLSGEPLEPGEAAELGLQSASTAGRPVSLSETASAQSVLVTLAELASLSGRVMILGFDPVDGLAPEQVRSLAQFLHPLIDHARNLLVILSGEQRSIEGLVEQGVIPPAVWDRFAQDTQGILLSRISSAQAKGLLEARLRQLLEPFLTLPEVRDRVEQDTLFPLGSDWHAQRCGGLSEFRTRDVIHWARDRWGQQQAKIRELGGPAWLEGFCPGRPDVPACLPACLAEESWSVPAAAPQATSSPLPNLAPVLGAGPRQPSPARRERGKPGFVVGWAVSAVLLAAIGLALWAPGRSSKDTESLAWRVEPSGRAASGSRQPLARAPAREAPSQPDRTAPGSASPAEASAKSPAVELPSGAPKSESRVEASAVASQSPPASARVLTNPPPREASPAPPRGAVPAPIGAVAPAAPASITAIAPIVPIAPIAPAAGGAAPGKVALAGGGLSPRAMAMGAVRAPRSQVKPIAIIADAELERLLTEAWGLIERGAVEPGRSKLLDARKAGRGDPRADFSLGLLDGLSHHDWASAEKKFVECVRCDPTNVPSLNNLAIAQWQNRHEVQAVKHWKTIVEQHAATPEVVQNLGRVRHLVKQGKARVTSALVKSLDELYTDAAVAASWSFQAQAGFRVMALQLADGRSVGWSDVRKMDYTPPPTAAESAASRPTASPPNTPYPGAAVPGAYGPGAFPRGPIDPRMQPYNPYAPGVPGYGPPAPNPPPSQPVVPRTSRRGQ